MIITDEGLMPIYENFPFQIWLETQMPEEIFKPSDYLLCYLVSNQIQGTVNGEANTYNAGDLFIIHPGDSYIIQAQDSYLLCIVRMDFNFILRCCDYQLPRFDHPILGIHLPSGTKERIIGQLIEKICYLTDLYYMAPKPSRTRMTYVFFDFAHFLIENFQKDFEETTPQHRRIFQIRDYLETNFSQPISLNMLAQNLGLTPQYLSSFIKEHFECTFGEYLNTVRLNHVAYDLIYTQNTITQIMYQNGFPNASGFNHAFKKRYSMTALEYRRTARAQHFGDMPKSPDAAFMAISQKNYKVFCSFRKNNRLPGDKLRKNSSAFSGRFKNSPSGKTLGPDFKSGHSGNGFKHRVRPGTGTGLLTYFLSVRPHKRSFALSARKLRHLPEYFAAAWAYPFYRHIPIQRLTAAAPTIFTDNSRIFSAQWSFVSARPAWPHGNLNGLCRRDIPLPRRPGSVHPNV